MTLGERIQKYRKMKVLSQEELANENESFSDLLKPEKVAAIIVGLLSDSFEYISGVILDVDKGKNWEG